jgi:hypothetical protein
VVLLTGLPGLLGHVVPVKSDLLMFSAPNNSIAPYAPFSGTERVAGLALLAIVRVVASSVFAGAADAVKTTLTWHVVGAVSTPVHEFPLIAKSPFPVAAPVNVTVPCPWMFTVTVCGALTAGLVPVGTPNERSVGDTVTETPLGLVCAFAFKLNIPYATATTISARTNCSQTLIAASLRGFPNAYTNFFCGAST